MLPKWMIDNIGIVIIMCILIVGLALFLQFYLNIKVENFVGETRKIIANYTPKSPPPRKLNHNLDKIKQQIEAERQRKLALERADMSRVFNTLDNKVKQKQQNKIAEKSNYSLAVEFKKRFDQMELDNQFDQFYKERVLRKMKRHENTLGELMRSKNKPAIKTDVKKYVSYNMPEEIPVRYKIEGDKMVLVDGYYKKSQTTMVKIPLGYSRDPSDDSKIIPLDNSTKGTSMFETPLVGEVPKDNKMMKEGYYKIGDKEVGLLPPGKRPNIVKLKVDTSKMPPRLIYQYGNGFVDEKEYYAKQYRLKNRPKFLPAGVYFVNPERTIISMLPYGKIADSERGFGYKSNANLLSKNGRFDEVRLSDGKLLNPKKSQFDVSQKRLNNYKAEFHEPAESILKKQDADKQGPMVMGPDGKMIQLPRVNVQGSPLYYKAGQYPYGKPSYVPSYEDLIFGTKSFKMPTEIYEKPL